MAEKGSGLHALLSLARPYDWFQRAVGAAEVYRLFLEAAEVRPGQRILDVGCGTAEILPYLPSVTYVGIDHSEIYIEAARRKHGEAGTFLVHTAGDLSPKLVGADGENRFDRVLLLGVLHHLDDEEALRLLKVARSLLAPGGCLASFDPSYTDRQGRLTRWILGMDRGENVRYDAEYQALAGQAFPRVDVTVHHDVLRIPYTHAIMICGEAGADTPAETDPAKTSR